MKIALFLAILVILALAGILALSVRSYRLKITRLRERLEREQKFAQDHLQQFAGAMGLPLRHPGDDSPITYVFNDILSQGTKLLTTAHAHEQLERDVGKAYQIRIWVGAYQELCQIFRPSSGFVGGHPESQLVLKLAREWAEAMQSGDPQRNLEMYLEAEAEFAAAQKLRNEADDIQRENDLLAPQVERLRQLANWFERRETMLRAHLISNLLAWGLVAEFTGLGKADDNKANLRQWASQNFFSWLRSLEYYGLALGDQEYKKLFALLRRGALNGVWLEKALANLAEGNDSLAYLSRWFSGAFSEAEERNPHQVLELINGLPNFFDLVKNGQVPNNEECPVDKRVWRMTGFFEMARSRKFAGVPLHQKPTQD